MAATMELGIPEIVIDANSVTVCGVLVPRPPDIGVDQWKTFWERAVEFRAPIWRRGAR